MMSRSVLGAFSAVLLALPAARASDWQVLSVSSLMTLETDAASIEEQPDGTVHAWERELYPTDQTIAGRSQKYTSKLVLWAFKCSAQQGAVLRIKEYSEVSASGSPIVDEDNSGSATWVTGKPDSLFGAGLKFACSHAPSAVGARSAAQSEATTPQAPPKALDTHGLSQLPSDDDNHVVIRKDVPSLQARATQACTSFGHAVTAQTENMLACESTTHTDMGVWVIRFVFVSKDGISGVGWTHHTRSAPGEDPGTYAQYREIVSRRAIELDPLIRKALDSP
jgi:hypothetical protein